MMRLRCNGAEKRCLDGMDNRIMKVKGRREMKRARASESDWGDLTTRTSRPTREVMGFNIDILKRLTVSDIRFAIVS